jgi:alpha-ribazole phosphatase
VNLYLVRHTTPDILPGICYGQTDVEVGASYHHEVNLLHTKLAGVQPVAIYSSPLKRCSQLAVSISRLLNSPVQYDPRLMELHFGDWELKAWNEIPRGMIDIWAEDLVMQAPPAGESFHNLALRVREFFEEMSASHAGQEVAVFTHAGVIRALLSHAMNLALADSFRLQIDYGSVTQIIAEHGVTRVAYVNR